MRHLVLDTETTGLDPSTGHRIVSLALIELLNNIPTGVFLHFYCNPERESDPRAFAAHGLDTAFLSTQSKFKDLASSILDFIAGSPLIAHNAPFDMGFLNAELRRAGYSSLAVRTVCTLSKARATFGWGKNRLDDLVVRWSIPNLRAATGLHGALVDALMTVNVYQRLHGFAVTEFTPEFLLKYGIGNGSVKDSASKVLATTEQTPAQSQPSSLGTNGGGATAVVDGDDSVPPAAKDGVADAVVPAAGVAAGDSGG